MQKRSVPLVRSLAHASTFQQNSDFSWAHTKTMRADLALSSVEHRVHLTDGKAISAN